MLRGPDGQERPLIEWTWRAARAVPQATTVVVATDDRRIAKVVENFGGRVVMTPTSCANGTERCAAALDELPDGTDLIINFQGDAPLTPPQVVEALVRRMESDPSLPMATPAVPCTPEMARHLMEDRAAGRVGGTTVVFNADHDALYFSKNVIPFVPDGFDYPVHLHLGVYAYRADALRSYAATPVSQLEQVEGLEQLRFLDAGIRVSVVPYDKPAGLIIELNNPGDAPLIEDELRRRAI